MHQGKPYGHLRLKDSNDGFFEPTEKHLAKMTGNTPEEIKEWLTELDDCGVLGRDKNHVIFSRKMLRDEKQRRIWKSRTAARRARKRKELEPVEGKSVSGDKQETGAECLQDVSSSPSPSPSPSPTPSSIPTGGRKSSPPNPYPFTIFWNRKEQRLRIDFPDSLIEHFAVWAKANGRNGVPVREVLVEAQPSFERHAIQGRYAAKVSPDELTVLFCKWVEKDILSRKGWGRGQPDPFDEALRKAEEEELGQ
jgi:hypothetical protein